MNRYIVTKQLANSKHTITFDATPIDAAHIAWIHIGRNMGDVRVSFKDGRKRTTRFIAPGESKPRHNDVVRAIANIYEGTDKGSFHEQIVKLHAGER